MRRRNGLIIAGILSFFVFALAQVPAEAVARWFAPDTFKLNGVSGTLWEGTAASIQSGRMRLGATAWNMSPLALLLGQLSGDVESQLSDGTLHGSVSFGLSGDISCTGCSYSGSVAGLQPLIPALRTLSGNLQLEIATLEIKDKWPRRAVGSVKLANVPLGAPGQRATFGPAASFEATVSADPVPEAGVIEATVQDAGGPLQLAGRIVLKPPGNFEFTGRAKARGNASPDVVNLLAALGPKAADGSTQITIAGSL